ncbi:MAG: hypothetical protein ACKVHE_32985 [Planctomycetales bacterium]
MKEQTKYGHVANDLVTQDELQELVELEKVSREAESQRRSIRNRILAGAKVEPGPSSVDISECQTIQLTQTTIRKLLGTLSKDFLAALPRQQIHRMKLSPHRHTRYKAKPKAVFDPASIEDNEEPDQEFDLTTFVLKATLLILKKQDAKSSSSTVGDYVTKDYDDFEEHGEVPSLYDDDMEFQGEVPEVISESID